MDLDAFLPAFAESINIETSESSLAKNAISTCAFLAECVGFPFAAICPRLNQMIVDVRNNIPDSIRWKTLKRINDSLSVSSLLHEYFPQFAKILIRCMRGGRIENIVTFKFFIKFSLFSIYRKTTVSFSNWLLQFCGRPLH